MSFLVHHILDKDGNKRATLFAQGGIDMQGLNYQVGWAMCCKRDVFAKKEGVALARTRAEKYAERPPKQKIPEFVSLALPKFLERCDKYFKGKHRPGWTHFA